MDRSTTDAKDRGVNVLADGRIDRAPADVLSISKTVYAMPAMNWTLRKKNPDAYAHLPSVVPLSAVPRANPYNPKVKTVVEYLRKWTPNGWEETYTYSDGTKEAALFRHR